jgi:hypothetical protein
MRLASWFVWRGRLAGGLSFTSELRAEQAVPFFRLDNTVVVRVKIK